MTRQAKKGFFPRIQRRTQRFLQSCPLRSFLPLVRSAAVAPVLFASAWWHVVTFQQPIRMLHCIDVIRLEKWLSISLEQDGSFYNPRQKGIPFLFIPIPQQHKWILAVTSFLIETSSAELAQSRSYEEQEKRNLYS